MSKAVGIVGWVVAVVVLAAMAYVYRVNQDLNVRLLASNEEREAILLQVEEQSSKNTELTKVIAELSHGLEQTQSRVLEIESATAHLLERRRSGFPSFEALGDGIGNALGDLGAIVDLIRGGQAILAGNPLSILTEGFLPQDAPEVVARKAVELQYGEFIRSLELDETRQAEVEDAFVRGLTAQIERARSSLLGEDAEEGSGEAVDFLWEHLEAVLSTEEMMSFEASRSNALRANLRRNFDFQLGLFARGLRPENRELVLGVLVDETLKVMEEDGTASTGGLGFRGQLDTQTTVYPRALERLEADLDDEQFAIVERFVENQLALVETSTRLFQGLLERFSGDPEEE